MPHKDPVWVQNLASALLGAALFGLFNVSTLVRSGRAVTLRDIGGIAINLACAAMVGIILALVFADKLAALIPVASLRDAGIISFAFGAFGWEVLPFLFPKVANRITGAIDQKLGG